MFDKLRETLCCHCIPFSGHMFVGFWLASFVHPLKRASSLFALVFSLCVCVVFHKQQTERSRNQFVDKVVGMPVEMQRQASQLQTVQRMWKSLRARRR